MINNVFTVSILLLLLFVCLIFPDCPNLAFYVFSFVFGFGFVLCFISVLV